MTSGIINVNKPCGITSFDVCAIVRRILGIRRIGHFGTLDPQASGVLPIAVGSACRIMEYLNDETKQYECSARLGISTDTLDIWGNILGTSDTSSLTKEALTEAILSFFGEHEQTPPLYSAIRVNGMRLYEYAKRKADVKIPKRSISVSEISVDRIALPDFSFSLTCSRGTYVRSICRDIGDIMGVGCAMTGLVRTRSGAFTIGGAIDVSDIKGMTTDELTDFIVSPDTALMHMLSANLAEREAGLFINGVILRDNQWNSANKTESRYRVYGPQGFLGIGCRTSDGFKAEKVLV